MATTVCRRLRSSGSDLPTTCTGYPTERECKVVPRLDMSDTRSMQGKSFIQGATQMTLTTVNLYRGIVSSLTCSALISYYSR